jgi:hypothetical protein
VHVRKEWALLSSLVIVLCGVLSGQVAPMQPTSIRAIAALQGQSTTPFPSSLERRSKAKLQLVRHGCLGPCPQYSVTVYGNGRVVYEGREAVRVKGRATAKIPEKALKDLLQKVNEMNFFGFQAQRGEACTVDGPEASITLSEPGRERTIDDHCLLGNEVEELEKAVDSAVHIQQWVFIDARELQNQIDLGWDLTTQGEEYAQDALNWDDADVLRVLIENGLPVDSRDRHGQTLLLRAVFANRTKSFKELLERGADPMAFDHNGLAPAPQAGFRGIETCKLFFKYGAGINDQDGMGQTMLISAATSGDLETVKFLIESGANPNLRRKDGYTAIELAKKVREQYQSLVDATFRPSYSGDPESGRALYTSVVQKRDAVIEYLKQHSKTE